MGIDESRRAAQQAAEWLVRLDSETCTASDMEAFERWRGADPLHAVAFRQAEAMWRDSRAVIRDGLVLGHAADLARWGPDIRAARYGGRRAAWLAIAAALTAMVVAMIIYDPLSPKAPPPGTRYATAVGEQRDIRLADGSTLTLDTQTVLVERFSESERRVDLQQGQVQFDVEGGPGWPFVVHAGGGTVTAVGTRFQVRVAGAGSSVTLLHGVVHVAERGWDGSGRIDILQPGQRIRLDANGRLGEVEIANVGAAEGWTQGKLHVDDWTLREFVAELNRYSVVQLRIDDPAIGDVRLSGVFQTRKRQNLERLLEQGWGIQSRRVAENEILLTRQ
ncbi:FecR family protein [Luteimonas viscosa]|nr:FecR domain-containing protein [Luteimonas viscosa]